MKSETSQCYSENVRSIEDVLELFFKYHASFNWDHAKDFIEHERDQFRAEHFSHVSSIMASTFNALSQLAAADKNYYTLQFFYSKVFQRKDSVKCSFENLKQEFIKLKTSGEILNQTLRNTITPSLSSSQFYTNQSSLDDITSEPAQEAICSEEDDSCEIHSINVNLPVKSEPENIKSSSSIFTKASQFFRFSKSGTSHSSSVPKSNEIANQNRHYCIKISDNNNGSNKSEHFCTIESMDRFAAHLCGQLVYYCMVRIDMIDLYEKIATPCVNSKFCNVNDFLISVEKIQNLSESNFHHPVLSYLKFLFSAECDILLNLLNVHVLLQDWKYLESLFNLQEAHNKLNMIINMRDTIQLGNSMGQPQSPKVPNTFGGINFLRRNFTSSSLTSSGSSNISAPTLSVPVNPSGNFSPLSSSTSFAFPIPKESSSVSIVSNVSNISKSSMKSLNPSSLPLLIQWLIRYKQFLLSKYSFYFHSLLMVHLTPSSVGSSTFNVSNSSSISNANSSATNYANTEFLMKHLCSKHLYDFHQRIVQNIKKYDSTYVILIFDGHSTGNVINSGYRSPYVKKDKPIGINSYPVIYSYPGEFPKSRIPSLIMIMNKRADDLNSNDKMIVEHDKQQNGISVSDMSNSSHNTSISSHKSGSISLSAFNSIQPPGNIRNASYYLVRPDPNFTLALICESKRLERDTLFEPFMMEMNTLLKGTKIFSSLKTGNWK